MTDLKKTFRKKYFAAVPLAAAALSLFLQGNLARAMVFKGDERDPLATDITNPACDVSKNQSNSVVATADNRFYTVVWQDDSCDGPGNGTGIYFEQYDAQNGGITTNGPERVNATLAGDQKNPSIAMDHSGNFVIVWEGNGPGDSYGIFAAAFRSDGTRLGSQDFPVNTHTAGVQDHPKAALDFGAAPNAAHAAVVWHGEGDGDTEGIYMQRFDADFTGGPGGPVGGNILVNTYTDGAQVNPAVAMNSFGETLVSWNGPGTGYPASDEVWMQGYDINGNPWGGTANNIRVNSASPATEPSAAADKSGEPQTNSVPGGKFVIVYRAGASNDIDARMVDRCSDSGGCPLGAVELNINSNSTSDHPAVAMDYLGNFTVAWQQDDGAANGNVNIRAVNYDYMGHRIDTNFRVNENTYFDGNANQSNAAITKDKDGEYIITWTSPQAPTNLDVRYRAFSTDMFKQGGQTLANNPTQNVYEYGVTSSIAPNGNRAVAWTGQDANGVYRIFYSLYDAGGNVIVKNQTADTVADSSANGVTVSFFKDVAGTDIGRFVMAWVGNDPNNLGSQQVMYREFDGSGAPVTPTELPVTATTNFYYYGQRVKAGYYENSGSTPIDRFAVEYIGYDGANAVTGVYSSYHTQNGFTDNTLQPPDTLCSSLCYSAGPDVYPDISGNDRVVYTWDYSDGDQNGVFAQEANGGTLSGAAFRVNDVTATYEETPDVAFVSPTQYVVTWAKCDDDTCAAPAVYAKRYNGSFSGNAPSTLDDDFVVYPGSIIAYPPGGNLQISSSQPRIAANTSSGSFIVVWTKGYNYDFVGSSRTEIDGKFFDTSPGLSNFGIGFIINSTQAPQTANAYTPDVSMGSDGTAIASWEGPYADNSGNLKDPYGANFQILNTLPTAAQAPVLPAKAELNITSAGKTLTIPSQIIFPSVPASTLSSTDVERRMDENTATGQPPFFQLEDFGGNAACSSGPCYSVTISATDFTYYDPVSRQTYTIPASNLFIKNYDGNHPGVVATGACGSPEASQSFNILNGNASDFSLDPSTCDYAALDTPKTLFSRVTMTNDTAKIQLFPELKIRVPPLTPPGHYTGTLTGTLQ